MGGAMGVFKQPAEFTSNKKHFCDGLSGRLCA